LGIAVAQRRGSLTEKLLEDDCRGRAFEGELTRGHRVEDDAERPEVGTSVDGVAASLLGRHVGYRSHSGTGGGEHRLGDTGCLCVLGAFVVLGESEVENFGVTTAGDENVFGFDVAMHDPAGVGGV
jgi:hypothetical protein